jgi:hypothetical protein
VELRAIERCQYVGCGKRDRRDDGARPILRRHRFQSRIDRRRWSVFVLSDACLLAKPGQVLEPGEIWCRALPELPSASWRTMDLRKQWRILPEVCGGASLVGLLQQTWYMHQAIGIADGPGHLLFPCELVSTACRDLPPAGLWWDLTPAVEHFEELVEGFALPAIQLRTWDQLRLAATWEVDLDATVGDPRFRCKLMRTRTDLNSGTNSICEPSSMLLR